MATKRSKQKRMAKALRKYLASQKNPGRRVRKKAMTVRGAKSVTIKQNPNGTVSVRVKR